MAVCFLLSAATPSPAQSPLEERLTEPSFATFYNGVRACLKSSEPDCLEQYLDPAFAFQPWWQSGDTRVSRAEFGRFARKATPTGTRESLWQSLARVFLNGRLRLLDGGTLFYSGQVECRAYELRDAYLITHCDTRP